MSHRNKNLVFTNSDIPNGGDDENENDNKKINKRKKSIHANTNNKRMKIDTKIISRRRRSIRLANKNHKDKMEISDGNSTQGSEESISDGKYGRDDKDNDQSSQDKSNDNNGSDSESDDDDSDKDSQDESDSESDDDSQNGSDDGSDDESDDGSDDESDGESDDDGGDNDKDSQDVSNKNQNTNGKRNTGKRRTRQNIKNLFDKVFGKKNVLDDDNDEYEEIFDELCELEWFKNLPDEDQDYYIEKMKELRTFRTQIPTLKDIMDLEIENEDMKQLICERYDLDDCDRMYIDYDIACEKFLRKMQHIKENYDKDTKNKCKIAEDKILSKSKYVESLKDRILLSHYSDDVKAIIYEKYLIMSKSGSDDKTKYKTWINTTLSIPNKTKKINLDESIPLNEAISKLLINIMARLNNKVYGMEFAKEEFICMLINMIANPDCKNKAIGIYGPPGIGKTLLASVIAEELDIAIEKISLGGATDSSYLEGHGFTYVGSEPGCIVKAIIKMGYTNGIIYLDELDKISKENNGKEVEHALLHITDFTQNHDYRDKYMPEIPIDLSKYIFVYSMNTINDLDSALSSRIPKVGFNGYTAKEKMDIVKKYLLPELYPNYGIKDGEIIFPDNIIEYLITNVKEQDVINDKSGVRSIKNVLNCIIKRINLYKIASVNGQLGIKLSYSISDFKLPYTIDINLARNICTKFGEVLDLSHNMMYM